MRRNYPTIFSLAFCVVALFILVGMVVTGCSGTTYDTMKAKTMDDGSPPKCVVVTDEAQGLKVSSRVLGVYCLTTTTTSTQVPH